MEKVNSRFDVNKPIKCNSSVALSAINFEQPIFMKNLKFIILFLFSTFLWSCQDVVEIDIPEGEKLIILNGLVTDTLPAWVDVLVSANFFDQGDNPKINGATVALFENDIMVMQLQQDTAGRYTSTFVGSIGKTYYIEVTVPANHPDLGGTVWKSNKELLQSTAPIDTIYQDSLEAVPPFHEAGIYIFYHFTDPVGLGDNYRIRGWKNDTLNSGPGSITAFNDEFFDGRSFDNKDLSAIQINGSPAKIGDIFKVEQSSISNEYLNYLILIQEQTVRTGGLFDPPPALLEGNIFGITEPSKTALGFFAASALSFAEYTVK